MNQPNLFDLQTETVETAEVALFALGEFQSRKKQLAERELPLDRLRGAFRRAAEHYRIEELSDEIIAGILQKMGAKIVQVPTFVAKHPFRVTVQNDLAQNALEFYRKINLEKSD
jgi:hypothetical protein